MKVIKNFNLVNMLNIPHQVKAALYKELVTPFDGSAEDTAAFWHEYDTFLILLEESDVDETLANASEDIQHFIQHVTDNPEFVLLFNDDDSPYLLALSVITDAGGGCYLLAPLSSSVTCVSTLSKMISPTNSIETNPLIKELL
jgi:hypothetical protein